jgi:predicted nucleotidyltransferase
MKLNSKSRNEIKEKIGKTLSEFPEVSRVIVFGSFNKSEEPNDIDLAVFQDSDENYIPLAMRYRKSLRFLRGTIAVDVLPVQKNPGESQLLREILMGESIYER